MMTRTAKPPTWKPREVHSACGHITAVYTGDSDFMAGLAAGLCASCGLQAAIRTLVQQRGQR